MKRRRSGLRGLVGASAFVGFMLAFAGCGTAGADAPSNSSGGASGEDGDGGKGSGAVSGDGGGAGRSGGAASAGGELGSSGGSAGSGQDGSGGNQQDPGALGAFPVEPSSVTRGGTMTFTNIGAPGSWPRRLDRERGDPACDYKDGDDTWGGHCCQTNYETASDRLAPFDEEMTLILKAIRVKQLAIYQPRDEASDPWTRVTAWDERGTSENIWFTQEGAGSASFPGDLTKNDCVGYVMQEPSFECGDGRDYYCPNDPGILHRGFSGSKLVAFLGSMDLDDSKVESCNGEGAGHPGPWVAFVASELVRDGGRKWNGLCNCYSKTDTVGDGCGEINVFEVVMDNNEFSNREFASTGVRSYQEGHVGGAVCKADCEREAFLPLDVDVVDACAKKSYENGPEIEAGGATDGCPVWRRPNGDRYFFILLDEETRTIQVGVVHPENLPGAMVGLLPELPSSVGRGVVDALIEMRLPAP